MSDASIELQGSLVTLIKADAGLTAIIAGRIYDNVPNGAAFPYLTIGNVQVLPDTAQEYDGSDIVFTIDGWSLTVGQVQIKQLGKALSAALLAATMTLVGYRVIEVISEQTQYLIDPDGQTKHGVFVYRARTEPSA
jgi:hypothetical protein